jgi:galactan endo-1,6-beta-galactosidase
VDANQRTMLLKARHRGAKYFEMFSNSPMWWMCNNDNPSGAAKASDDNLAPENYERFAVYLATVARYAKDYWGITFTTVEPFNEPTARYWHANGKQEGCHFSQEAQAAVLPLLRAELDKRGLKDIPIAASDESLYDQALATWNSFDAATKAIVKQVNVHGYQKQNGRRDLLFQAVRGRRLWNSEYGENDPTGLEMARNLHFDLRYLHPAAWTYWQPFDGGGWGLIDTDMRRNGLGATNPKYFVLAQYTRHIHPGMTILETGETDTVAAYDVRAAKLVIVARNGSEARSKTFDLSRFTVPNGLVTRWITEPNESSRYEQHKDIRLTGRRFDVVLPANSVQTFEVENVSQL